jgi:thioredoxin-like negative regulator of GroEL
MEDQDLREWIRKLVHEEHELFRQEAQGAATYAQRERMREIEEYLDQCWDLLRQRRAKRTAGLDPEAASVRDVETVEHYDQ